MKAKTVCSVLLTIILLFSLCGCGGDETTSGSYVTTTTTTNTTTTADATTTTTETTTTATEATTTTTTTAKPTTTTEKPTTTTKATTTAKATTTTKATTTKPVKKSWFDEHGFKVTPLTLDFCMCNAPKHICPSDKSFGISEDSTDKFENKTKSLDFKVNINSYSCMHSYAVPFDRYTGTVITPSEVQFEANGSAISAFCSYGKGAGGFDAIVICTEDYDGAVFLVSKDINYPEGFFDGKLHTVDEIIDFDTAEYYFFSASNK